MVYSLIFALLFQAGPKDLQVSENAKIKPPLIIPKGTTIPVALVNSISTKTAKDDDGVYARTTFHITINNEIAIQHKHRHRLSPFSMFMLERHFPSLSIMKSRSPSERISKARLPKLSGRVA